MPSRESEPSVMPWGVTDETDNQSLTDIQQCMLKVTLFVHHPIKVQDSTIPLRASIVPIRRVKTCSTSCRLFRPTRLFFFPISSRSPIVFCLYYLFYCCLTITYAWWSKIIPYHGSIVLLLVTQIVIQHQHFCDTSPNWNFFSYFNNTLTNNPTGKAHGMALCQAS
jgi:hypothetical protein